MDEKLLGVLIVDDEEIVRKGMRNIIDWEKNGCTIIDEASNGDEALEKIHYYSPSIVLLDINMPGKTGIAVLEDVYKHPDQFPTKPRFLILSGYSDFDYAQKAINYGAKGYIVKPVDEDELEEKIRSLVQDIKQDCEVDNLRSNAKTEDVIQKFSQMFLFGDVEDGFDPQEDDNTKYQVGLIALDLCGQGDGTQSSFVKEEAEDGFRFNNHISFFMDNTYVLIFKNENEESVVRHLERFCSTIQHGKQGSIMSLGEIHTGLEGALKSFNQARILLDQLFFYEHKHFLSWADYNQDTAMQMRVKSDPGRKQKASIKSHELMDSVPQLVRFIEIYDLQKIDEIIDTLTQKLKLSSLSTEEIKKLCMAFIVETQNEIHNKHPEKELDTVSALDLVNLLYSQNYFDEVIAIVEDFTKGLAESFTSNASNSTILKVIQYVKTNYNTDLKLEMLGNLFNCNSAYLGKKFREYTGVSFNTYLDIIRIEQAKHLLLNKNLKIYEISKLVGYSNTDYFYLKFKKHTNMTPKEYKNNTEKASEGTENEVQN